MSDTTTLHATMLGHVRELLRETFEGGLPGEGTQYLDHASGIRRTLGALSAAQASARPDGRPSIAAHARHMAFHLRVTSDWVRGVRPKRDWLASFEPHTVTPEEWAGVREELDAARAELVTTLESLPVATFAEEGGAIGAIAHLAYHLGAIRQLVHRV